MAWYEIDTNWYVIWLLSKLGLIWQIQVVKLKEIKAGLVAAPNGRLAEAAPQFTD